MYFLHKMHHSLLQHYACSHFKSKKSPAQSTITALNRFWEGHLFIIWEWKQWRKSINHLAQPHLGTRTLGDSNFSLFCVYPWVITKAQWILILGYNKFWWKDKFTNTESVNNEDRPYHLKCPFSNNKTIVRHTKKRESMSHTPEKKQALETACGSKQIPHLKYKAL